MCFSSSRWLNLYPHLSKYDHPIQNNSTLTKSNNESSSLSQSRLHDVLVHKKNISEDAGEVDSILNQHKNQNTGERNRLGNTTMNELQTFKEAAGIGTMSLKNHRLQMVMMRVSYCNMKCKVKDNNSLHS